MCVWGLLTLFDGACIFVFASWCHVCPNLSLSFGPTHRSLLLLHVLWHTSILLAILNIIIINLHFEPSRCSCKLLDCSQGLLELTGDVRCSSSLLVLFTIIDDYTRFGFPYSSCKLLGCSQWCFEDPLFAGGFCYSATLSLFYIHHLGKLLTIWCSHDELCSNWLLWIIQQGTGALDCVCIMCHFCVTPDCLMQFHSARSRFCLSRSLHYLMLLPTPPCRFRMFHNASVHLNFVRCWRLSLFVWMPTFRWIAWACWDPPWCCLMYLNSASRSLNHLQLNQFVELLDDYPMCAGCSTNSPPPVH